MSLSYLRDFINLFFPRLCASCGNFLYKNEPIVCTKCLFSLPKTHFLHSPVNPVAHLFWGRVSLVFASACFRFQKGNSIQHLLFKLKYSGVKEIGVFLGKIAGTEIQTLSCLQSVDIIMPVPLHWKKLKSRGYNQSECIAQGFSFALDIPVDGKSLYRAIENPTQTKKSRYARWENVEGIFRLRKSNHLRDTHILLVDDVVTTGATIEACVQVLSQIPGVRVSAIALAVAD